MVSFILSSARLRRFIPSAFKPGFNPFVRGFLIAASLCLAQATELDPILIDGHREGRRFDGIGGVSAGASTRLLIDYPEPQRSQVLDYLFKPGFGASFQRLKVEIGGDMNSTDGTEPTHMRSRTDTNYHRGYEWWLMKEAHKRNPDIILGCLPWGAPAWIGDGQYYSQDMADYIANFIDGAAKVHGLEIQYTGIWNEKPFDASWIKLLRRTLDARGLQRVKIAAADEWKAWTVVDALLADPELSSVVDYVSSHYPYFNSPAAAKTLPQPLWSGEDGTWSGDWSGSRFLAQMLSRNYVVGKMTATDIWSLVTSYYDILPLADSGPMLAKEPWSGHFVVQPAIWVLAHTAQFTRPGWTYLDGSASALLSRGGSIATLKATNNSDFTMVIETFGAFTPQSLAFQITNGLSSAPLALWRTRETEEFARLESIQPLNGAFTYTFDPECIYTLTTLTNGSKGLHTPPPRQPFPFPYSEDFESYSAGSLPKYLSDQAGSFEVVERAGPSGKSLRQVVSKIGIQWVGEFTPFTVVGDKTWTDYEISADVLLEGEGFVSLLARLENNLEVIPEGYYVRLYANPGRWEIWKENTMLTSGPADFTPGAWHQVRLQCHGTSIRAYLDGHLLGGIVDDQFSAGLAAVGSGWNTAQFDNIVISPVRGSINIAPFASVTASSFWISDFAPSRLIDGDPDSRWVTVGSYSNQWAQFEFPQPVEINRVAIWEFGGRITSAALESWHGDSWSNILSLGILTNQGSFSFNPVTTSKLRFLINNANYGPILHELQLFNDHPSRSVQLNEWMLRNTSTIADPADADFEPWIELRNTTANTIDLAGYTFILQGSQTKTSTVPAGILLQPGEFLIVWADGEESQTDLAARSLHLNFALEENSKLSLFSPVGQPIDSVPLTSGRNDQSSGGNPDTAFTLGPLPLATPGRPNSILLGDIARGPGNSGFTLRFHGAPFARYQLRSRPSISNSSWMDGPTLRADGLGTVLFRDPTTIAPSTFYQAVER